MHLDAITVFPVKSCRGTRVDTATVQPWGLEGDRRWMLVDDAGDVVTAREHPRLLLARPALRPDGGLDLTHPDAAPLTVAAPDAPLVPVQIWKSRLPAAIASDEAHAWFSKIAGIALRLVHLDDPTRRRINPDFSRPTDRVSFADGYPLLLATTASLDALNDLIAAGPRPEEGPLPMTRFRPNVVVAGAQAWEEDGWRRLRIGQAEFRAVKGCNRCVMTMIDPDTLAKNKEPIATLARHRRWEGETWFAMNLVPDTPGATIHIGDEVEVLEAVAAPNGPPR